MLQYITAPTDQGAAHFVFHIWNNHKKDRHTEHLHNTIIM